MKLQVATMVFEKVSHIFFKWQNTAGTCLIIMMVSKNELCQSNITLVKEYLNKTMNDPWSYLAIKWNKY